MSQRPQILFADEEEATQKLARKSKESPFMIAGGFFLWNSSSYEIIATFINWITWRWLILIKMMQLLWINVQKLAYVPINELKRRNLWLKLTHAYECDGREREWPSNHMSQWESYARFSIEKNKSTRDTVKKNRAWNT